MCREIAAKSIKDFELPASIATAVYPHPHSLPTRGRGLWHPILFFNLNIKHKIYKKKCGV
jgi:hypothetical protein